MIDPHDIDWIRSATIERLAGKMGRHTFGVLCEPTARKMMDFGDSEVGEDRIAATVALGLCDALKIITALADIATDNGIRKRLDDLATSAAAHLHASIVVASRKPKPRSRPRRKTP